MLFICDGGTVSQDYRMTVDVPFGSLAAPFVNISLMSASEGKADLAILMDNHHGMERRMSWLLTLLVALSLTGCGVMVPAKGKMPAFGALFDADIHAVAASDEAKIIFYRDPDLDERLKFSFTINPWAYFAGYVYSGAFLEATRSPGTLNISSHRVWWDENIPVGDSILWKIEPGEPPPAPGRETKIIDARVKIEALAGTVTYLRLNRTKTDGIEPCGETSETIRMCRFATIESKLEIVAPNEAQRELAGLRRTIYGRAEQ